MNIPPLIQTAIIFALSCTPISLIVFGIISSLSSKHPSGISKTTVICTTELKALTKEDLNVQSLSFDKYKAIPHQTNKYILLEDTETNEEKKVLRTNLSKEFAIKHIATTAVLCRYSKTEELEGLMINFLASFGLEKNEIREKYEIIAKIPIKEDKKFSSIVAIDKETKEIFSFIKGQAGELLKKCTRIIVNGKKIDIDTNTRKKLKNKISKLHKNGQKTILFAYKPLPFKRLSHYEESFVENDLVFLGIIGLGETLNMELAPVVEKIKEMGIKQYILSSGKEQKSIAIGHQLGITTPKYFEEISTEYLNILNDEQLEKMLMNKEKDYTFFRLTEDDKKRIIGILKKQGEKVKINDQKNNLFNIAEGIRKTKNRKANRKKLFIHALSCKIMEIILFVTALVFQAPLGLTIILILALDLTVNLFLEGALNRETPPIEDTDKKSHLFVIGIFGGVIISWIYIWSLLRGGWSPGDILQTTDPLFIKASSITFLLLCLIQIINAHNLKNTTKSVFKISLFKTPYLTISTIILFLMIFAITKYEIIMDFIKTTKLNFQEWQIIIFASILLIIIEEFRKYADTKS